MKTLFEGQGSEITRAAKRRELTQVKVAKAANIGLDVLKKYWQGEIRVPLHNIEALAKVLGVPRLRLLVSCGYAPGALELLDIVDGLQEELDHALGLRTHARASVPTGLAQLTDALGQSGQYSWRVVPLWRGTATRLHFSDLVILESWPQGAMAPTRELLEQKDPQLRKAMQLSAAHWSGRENWLGNKLVGDIRQPNLVINVPRLVADARRTPQNLSGPAAICVLGGHWCGTAEVAALLASDLGYDYTHAGLRASKIHGRLVQRWAEDIDGWEYDRLDVVRGLASRSLVSRPLVWAGEYWNDSRPVRVVTDTENPPFVILLAASDALLEYASRRRQQDGHTSTVRELDLASMRNARDTSISLAAMSKGGHHVVNVDLVKGARTDAFTGLVAAANDEFFDLYVRLSHQLRMIVS